MATRTAGWDAVAEVVRDVVRIVVGTLLAGT
jgi:hypothetical protein